MTKQYRLPHPSEVHPDAYISPPPKDSDGELVRRSLAVEHFGSLTPLTAGEALAAVHDDPEAWSDTWRRRFPESAAVVDGIHQSEAGVVTEDEEGSDG